MPETLNEVDGAVTVSAPEDAGVHGDAAQRRVDIARVRAVRRFAAQKVRPFAGSGPVYDSVVIAGSGIGALTFAGRLVQDPRFAGKVTIVAPEAQESRRLIQGVNLRGFGADFMAAAVGTTHAGLVREFASAHLNPVCHRQTVGLARRRAGKWELESGPAPWLGGHKGSVAPSAYGFRNGRVTAGLASLLASRPVRFVSEKVSSAEQLREYAEGDRPLLVNATGFPTLLGGTPIAPQRMVIAVQGPFATSARGLDGIDPQSALAPAFPRSGVIDVGYYTPFSDPLSPRSDWYGIVSRVVDAKSSFDKDAHHEAMIDELVGLAETMGLDPDDHDETLSRSVVPAYPWGSIPASPLGVLNLSLAYSGGNPAVYADGMTTAAVGGYLGAEAVLAGVADIEHVVRRALRNIHRYNYLWYCETNRITPLSVALLRAAPRPAMLYPHTASRRVWLSAA